MPGCSAFNCTNRSEYGKIMKIFPKDEARRKLWAEKANGPGWQPSKNSYLCEDHFDKDQWEKVRVDGKRKLKISAIPEIFPSKLIPIKLEPSPPPEDHEEKIKSLKKHIKVEHNYVQKNIFKNMEDNNVMVDVIIKEDPSPEDFNGKNDMKNNVLIMNRENIFVMDNLPTQNQHSLLKINQATNPTTSSRSTKDRSIFLTNNEKLETICERQQIELNYLKIKLRKKNAEICKLKKQISESNVEKMKNIFNNDQIEYMIKKGNAKNDQKVQTNWSDDTIKKSWKIRSICGEEGYEELLRQGLPFPSARTLRRRRENVLRVNDICSEIFDSDLDNLNFSLI